MLLYTASPTGTNPHALLSYYAVSLALVLGVGVGCMSTDQRDIIKLGEAAIERHGEVTDILSNPKK